MQGTLGKLFLRLCAPGEHRSKQIGSDSARAVFPSLLKHLLERPEGERQECHFCGHDNPLATTQRIDAVCLFSGLELRRFVCGACGGVFGPTQLIDCRPAELCELYGCLYQFYKEGFSEPFQEKTFYLMNPSRHGEYLNYACGDWTAGCERLRSLGWHVWGYEPFQQVRSAAILIDADIDTSKKYDGLMSHNFVEHVQNPFTFFRKCHSMLKPGGVMAHSSPCFDYVYAGSPLHLFFYCGQAVERLAARTDFVLRSEHRADQDHPGHQYVCCVFEKRAG